MSFQLLTLDLLLTALLLAKLWSHGLVRRYPAFVSALAFTLLAGAALRLIPIRTNAYALTYMCSQFIEWTLRYFVLRELLRLILDDHRGIREAVRIGMWVSLGGATLLPCGMALLMQMKSGARFPWLEAYFLLHQSVSVFFAILVIGTLAFLAWFPVRLRRNLVLYCIGYSVQFLAQSAAILINNLTANESLRQSAGLGYQLVGLAVSLVWLLGLGRGGESPMVSVGHRWNPAAADHSLRQLAELNASLTSALRKER